MIDLLLSGSINNRLLCEIATHDKFKELIADTEIFVDGVATKRFNDLNSSLETVRTEIINQNPNVSNDHTLRTLSAAQVSEEDFFCHVTHKTWDSIIKDIRKNHEQDIDSIPEDDTALSLQKIRQIMISSGNNMDKFIEIFCNSFQLKYKRLSEDNIFFLKNQDLHKYPCSFLKLYYLLYWQLFLSPLYSSFFQLINAIRVYS